ncbi:hypothetical protein KC345_g46 [Hortaea werneckii]|nr:hypothetical protein KC345_g46 [Hortaea werneckii]
MLRIRSHELRAHILSLDVDFWSDAPAYGVKRKKVCQDILVGMLELELQKMQRSVTGLGYPQKLEAPTEGCSRWNLYSGYANGMPKSAVAEAGAEPDVPLADAFSSSSVGILASLRAPFAAKASSRSSSLCHQSLSTQPATVPLVAQPTTVCGLTRSWKIAVKQHTKMTTEQTCWTMIVLSATSGQNSNFFHGVFPRRLPLRPRRLSRRLPRDSCCVAVVTVSLRPSGLLPRCANAHEHAREDQLVAPSLRGTNAMPIPDPRSLARSPTSLPNWQCPLTFP